MAAVSSLQTVDLPLLQAQTAVGGFMDAAIVHLFVNDFNPTKLSVLADFVEATFNGYAAAPITGVNWASPYVNAQGNAETSTLAQVAFTANGIAVQESVFGYYLTDDPATVFRFGERFVEPVPMGIFIGQRLGLILRSVLNADGLDGSAAEIL